MESWNLGLSISSLDRRCIFSNSLSRSLQSIFGMFHFDPNPFFSSRLLGLSNLILSLSMEAVVAFGRNPPPTGEVGVVAALLDAAADVAVAMASGLSLERLFLEWWYCCLEEGDPLTAEGYLESIPR